MRSGLPLNFELTAEGNSLGQSSFKEPDSDRLRPYCAWINLLNRARAIVRCFPISAAVPIVVSPQQFIWIEELYDLVTNGRHEYQAVGGEFTFVTDQPTSLEDFVGRTITMDIKVVKTYSVFETPICIGPLQEATINVKVVSIVRNLKNEVEIACSLSTDSHVTLVSLENPIKQQPLS
jgi:hypothetical protein